MSHPTAGTIRKALQGLCANTSDQISYADVFHVLEITDAKDKDRVRRAMGDFLKRGELERVSTGVFTYHPEAAKRPEAEGHKRMWRAIRTARPGWDTADIAQITRMSRNHVQKYCRWLHAEGYIAHHGRDGNTQRWRATTKGMNHRGTPYPPRQIKDPFKPERLAACRLVRCFMDRDPSKPVTSKKIVAECTAILARFSKGEANAQA